jgi:hypothetical protein
MIDRWPFAKQLPSSQLTYWGSPARAKLKLKPIIIPGPMLCDDGHPPFVYRGVFLHPDADHVEPGSPAERDHMARAIVVRNALIQRGSRLSEDDWILRGYEIQRGDEAGVFTRPDLTVVAQEDLRHPINHDQLAVARSFQPFHPLLRACVALGLDAGRDGIAEVRDQIAATAPFAADIERLAGLILAIISMNMMRGFDLYRSHGHALNAAFPWIEECSNLDSLLPVLDASVLLSPPTGPSDTDVVADLGWILHQLHVQGLPS